MRLPIIWALLCLWAASQSVPTISPLNAVLRADTSYTINYYSFKTLTSGTTYFTVNFNASNIIVPSGNLSCTIRYNGAALSAPSCFCVASLCTFKPNASGPMNTNILISFGGARNPSYLSNQNLPVQIVFSPLVASENYVVAIPFSAYTPMQIAVDSLSQSDYGVGTYPVTYTFKLTLPSFSRNPQLQVVIPNEVSFNQITSSLSLNGAVQNIAPMQVLQVLIFNLQTAPAALGTLTITLAGLGNPQFLGNSSSFTFTLIETTAVVNCANCKIAEITQGLVIQSQTPGVIQPSSLSSTNLQVGQMSTISFNSIYFAPIEVGGSVKIKLDASLQVVTPVHCDNVFGFTTSDSNEPTCTYDPNTHEISTLNFALPNLVTYGNGIISFVALNPPDSRTVTIAVHTYDVLGRLIGATQNPFTYSATPRNMTATLAKSSNDVATAFNLSALLTLGQTLDSSHYIELVLPPAVPYNLPAIRCSAAGLDLNCTSILNSQGQLIIAIKPPCVQCSLGAQVTFTVVNLRNADYINEGNQQVYVNIRSSLGIIEGTLASVPLVPSGIVLNRYDRPTAPTVGSSFDLLVTFVPPAYIISRGGRVLIQFTAGSIFVAPLTDASGMLTGLRYELSVLQSNSSLPNMLEYNTDSPASLLSITTVVCDGQASSCSVDTPISVLIKGLRNGFTPSLPSNDTITITTSSNEPIALRVVPTSSYSPLAHTGPLNATFSRPITNTHSAVDFAFTAPSVLFDSAILTLPNGVTFSGECSLSVSLLYATQFSCQQVDSTHVKISLLFELAYMMSGPASYFIRLSQVSTPTSTRPLMFQLDTSLGQSRNQGFSQLVAMGTPLPLELTSISASNSTINEVNVYSLQVSTATQSYSGVQLIIPKLTSLTSTAWATSFSYTLTENATHYILASTGKISSSGISFQVRNTFNTVGPSPFTVLLKDSTYDVQRLDVTSFANQPIALGFNCTSANRSTGSMTKLTCTLDRNNPGYGETQMLFILDTATYNWTGASFNGQPLSSPTVTLPIDPTTPRVLQFSILGLQNRRFVPNSASAIGDAQVKTVLNGSNVIGKLAVSADQFMPNTFSSMPCNATRNATKSGQFSTLLIACQSRLALSADYLAVKLPDGQATFTGITTCQYSDGQACTILSSNSSNMVIAFRPSLQVLLGNVLNGHNNLNPLTVSMQTRPNAELIEQASLLVVPSIQLEQLHVVASASSGQVSSKNLLTLQVTPQTLAIQPTHLLTLSFPSRTFTRQLNSQDCVVLRSDNTSFTGCTYQFEGAFLSGMTVNSIGPIPIAVGTSVTIQLPVTNGPAPYPFAQSAITVNVNQDATTYLSQGTAPLVEVYPALSAFSLVSINSGGASITQSSLKGGAANQLGVKIPFVGNLLKGSQVVVMVPKDSFSLGTSTQMSSEDASYFYLQYAVQCQAEICQNYTISAVFSLLNNPFLKTQRNSLLLYAQYDSLPISNSYTILLAPLLPLSPPRLALARTSNIATESSLITLAFQLQPQGTSIGVVSITVSPSMVNSLAPVSASLQKYSSSGVSGSAAEMNPIMGLNSMGFAMAASLTGDSLLNEIRIQCLNPLAVPIANETYWLKISNSTHTLYQIDTLEFSSKLIPLSIGATLTRASSQVTSTTPVSLLVDLPLFSGFPYSDFSLRVNTSSYGVLNGSQTSVVLPPYINPAVTSGEKGMPVSICNSSHCIYRNSNQPLSPSLAPQLLSSLALSLPASMQIATTQTLSLTASSVRAKAKFVLSLPAVLVGSILSVSVSSAAGAAESSVAYETETVGEMLNIRLNSNLSTLSLLSCSITFQTPQYQVQADNAKIQFYEQAPSAVQTWEQTVTIFGFQLASTLSLTSFAINESSNYTICTNSLPRSGVLRVQLPAYLSGLYMSSNSFATGIAVSIDAAPASTTAYQTGYQSESDSYFVEFPISSLAPKFCVLLKNVKNPHDNRPLTFRVWQHEQADAGQVYGYSNVTARMTQLAPIEVSLAERNATGINQPIQINLTITLPLLNSEGKQMRVLLPSSQVQVTADPCVLLLDGLSSSHIALQGNPQTNHLSFQVDAGALEGEHIYSVEGCLLNSQFSQSPAQADKVYVSVGEPYQCAESSLQDSVFITPLVTTGNLKISELESSSLSRLTYTKLSFRLEPEHYGHCAGIVVSFSSDAYYLHKEIEATINGQNTPCQVVSPNQLYIHVGALRNSSLQVELAQMINFISSGPMNIFTVKETAGVKAAPTYNPDRFGVIDFVATGAILAQLSPSSPSVRLIIPEAYVSSADQTILIMIDSRNPTQYPSAGLYLQLDSSLPDCSRSHIAYSSRVSLTCRFAASGPHTFSIQIKDAGLADGVVLGQIVKSTYVYPELKPLCSNFLCDKCSDKPGGGEYCFECREGKYSHNGVCVSECPSGEFPYLSQTCESCSPDCGECFNVDDHSCLSCSDPSHLLDSGSCDTHCSTGFPHIKYCVESKECTGAKGCRLCSSSGFCYQCLPGWDGEPNCSYEDNMPPNLFVFIILPIVALAVGLSVYSCAKSGAKGSSGLWYFMLAVLEFFSMVFLIARSQLPVAMIICAVVLLRIIISIVAYETYYLKTLDDQSLLLGQEERDDKSDSNKPKEEKNGAEEPNDLNDPNGCKMKVTKFSAHLLCCEAYDLLKSQLGQPKNRAVKHHTWYMRLNVASRLLLMVMAVVAVSAAKFPSDLLWLPVIALCSSGAILGMRLLESQAAGNCIARLRATA